MNDDIEVSINIEVRQPLQYSGGLRLSDTFKIKSRGFLDIAKILSQFDELARKLANK